MYFKLLTNHTSYGGATNLNDGHRRFMMHDLFQMMTGAITQTSQLNSDVWKTDACVITGAAPTAGIYTAGGYNTHASVTYNAHFFEVIKKHYGYKTNNSFTATRTFRLHWIDDYGLGPRMTTHTSNNSLPGNTGSNWVNSASTTGYHYRLLDSPSSSYSWEGIINDDIIIFQVSRNGPYTSGAYVYTSVMADQEYQPTIDDHYLTVNQYYCPTAIGNWSDNQLHSELVNRYASSTSGAHWHQQAWGKSQVYGENQNGVNLSISSNGQQHKGYYGTGTYNNARYASTWPPMWHDMPSGVPIANGDTGYQMYPMYLVSNYGYNSYGNGTTGYHYDYRSNGRMMGLWRTNDDSYATGERVVDASGTAWRAFRSWKCGGGYGGNADNGYRVAVIMAKEDAA